MNHLGSKHFSSAPPYSQGAQQVVTQILTPILA